MPNFKTDWSNHDYFTYGEYNRICSNILKVKAQADILHEVTIPNLTSLSQESLGYADYINDLENSLIALKSLLGDHLLIPTPKQWVGNQKGFTGDELNRIETSLEILYNHFVGELSAVKSLSFRLGGDHFDS